MLFMLCLLVRQPGLLHPFLNSISIKIGRPKCYIISVRDSNITASFYYFCVCVKQVISPLLLNNSQCRVQSQNFSQFNQTVLEAKALRLSYSIYLAYFYYCIKMLSTEGVLPDKTAEWSELWDQVDQGRFVEGEQDQRCVVTWQSILFFLL